MEVSASVKLNASYARFGPCSDYGECALVCPAGIPLSAIGAVNKERLRAGLTRPCRTPGTSPPRL